MTYQPETLEQRAARIKRDSIRIGDAYSAYLKELCRPIREEQERQYQAWLKELADMREKQRIARIPMLTRAGYKPEDMY